MYAVFLMAERTSDPRYWSEPPDMGCWKPNSHPLQEQSFLFIAEPSLQPHSWMDIKAALCTSHAAKCSVLRCSHGCQVNSNIHHLMHKHTSHINAPDCLHRELSEHVASLKDLLCAGSCWAPPACLLSSLVTSAACWAGVPSSHFCG